MTEGRVEGERHTSGPRIRVAIVGVGNCAASLVQGVHYYRDADPTTRVPGLMHVQFGQYHVGDLEFVAAFDVDAKKVGRDLSEAIVASENNTIAICDVPPLGVTVQRGHTMDGLGEYYRDVITESDERPVDVVGVRRAIEEVGHPRSSRLTRAAAAIDEAKARRRGRSCCWAPLR